ncbi:hypothetical protein [Pontibacter diazotrophicus]|nr:hypothetical protein [Pontibacter diazotrophicus]
MNRLFYVMCAASLFAFASCSSPATEAEDVAEEVEDVAEEQRELEQEIQEYNEEVAEEVDTTTVVIH